MQMEDLLIQPIPGYTSQVGILLSMLEKTRETTKKHVAKLNTAQLDWRFDAKANTIGMLLGHIAAVEEFYAIEHLEGRKLSAEEDKFLTPRLDLGDMGYAAMRNTSLHEYLENLDRARERTTAQLKQIDDTRLNALRKLGDRQASLHWMLYHVMEDELRHTGQISWLLKRLPAGLN